MWHLTARAAGLFRQLRKLTTQGVAQSEFVYLVEELGLAARFQRPVASSASGHRDTPSASAAPAADVA